MRLRRKLRFAGGYNNNNTLAREIVLLVVNRYSKPTEIGPRRGKTDGKLKFHL